MKLIQGLLHDVHDKPRQPRVTLLELANLIQWLLRRRLLTTTKPIRVRRLGILDSRRMIAMRSLMATMTRRLATAMSASNSRFDMSGPGV
jgi:hypothetical protein